MSDDWPFELSMVAEFEAAHKLKGEALGGATRLHGHTFRVVVSVRGSTLREDGLLHDHYGLRAAIDEVVGELHHSYLNEIDGLAGRNSTEEVVAQYLWEGLAGRLAGSGLGRLSVEVAESPRGFARFEKNLEPTSSPAGRH